MALVRSQFAITVHVACGAKTDVVLANMGKLGIRDVMFSSLSEDS
jgi:hypothetical protein